MPNRLFDRHRLASALPLMGLLFFGLLLRLPALDGRSSYILNELERDLLALKSMVAGQGLLLGPVCVHGGWFFPPAYHYLSLPLAWLTGFRPYSLALTSLVFSLAAVGLIFVTARTWFRSGRAAWLAAGLLTLSMLDISFAKYGSNPNALVFFGLLFFYQLEKFIGGRNRRADAVILGMAFAIATQLHTVAFISLPLVLLAVLILKKIRTVRPADALLFSLTVIILYAPYLYAQLTSGFRDVAGLLAVAGDASGDGTFANRFADTLSFVIALVVRYGQTFGDRLALGLVLLAANIGLITAAWFIDARRHPAPPAPAAALPAPVRTTLIAWTGVPLAVLLLPQGGIDILPIYYFTMLVPAGYLLFALGLERLLVRGFRRTAGIILASYVLWQVVQIVQYHQEYPSLLTAWLR